MSILRIIDGICKLVVGAAILVMVASISGQVFYRAVLDSYIGWAEEAARFSFVWLTFLGSASAFRSRRHLAIDFLPEFLGSKGRIVLDMILCVIVLALAFVLVVYGWQLTQRTMTQIAPATGVTIGYIYIALPISAALISLYAIVDVFRNGMAIATDDLSRAAIRPTTSIVDAALKEDGA